MQPTTWLKLASIAFAALWTGWMIWSTASFDDVGITILSICGALAGVAWYVATRWIARLIRFLPRDGH